MGPRAGLSEIALPAVQPGSSIMPGKVNPSVPEMVNQVCFQVMGCDTTVAIACEAGQLELNVMMPVIAWNALHASTILREALKVFRLRCVDGIAADEARARELLDRSTGRRHRAQPVSRLRGDGGHREGIGEERQVDPRDRARTRPARRGAAERDPVGGVHDARRIVGEAGQDGQEGGTGWTGRTGRRRQEVKALIGTIALLLSFLPFRPSCLASCLLLPSAPPARPALSAQPAHAQSTKPKTRLFGTQDLGLLEAPDREQWQKPDQIMDALGVAEGSKVAGARRGRRMVHAPAR